MYKLRVSCGVRFHLMFLTFTSAFLKSSCFVFGGLVLDACWSSSSYICTKSAILPATTRYYMILPLLLLFTPCLRIMFVPQSVCPARGGLPQCREHVRCICSISARFIWAPPAHEETEDQALSDGELLGSVDASPPRFA